MSTTRPRIVIVGAGFGGLSVVRGLRRAPVDILLLDRRNYHLFQPLLYQVATAGLSPADIAWPIRSLVARQKNVHVEMAQVEGVDTARKQVVTAEGRGIGYDRLVLATGARHAYFGHDDWERVAPGLKKIPDATAIRERVLLAFEEAETEADEEKRRRLLTFIVIGGGPTGVEMAGALAELARFALSADFRHIDPRQARVILIEAGHRVLAGFDENLSRTAEASLAKLGVEVRLGRPVTLCDGEGVMLGEEGIAAGSIVWAAGVAASRAAKWLGAEADRAGRVVVAPDLSVPGHGDIFVIGDTAAVAREDGTPVPGIAPAAKQMGAYVADVIARDLRGEAPPPAFRYRHQGDLATIGRSAAVADFNGFRLSGWFAWVFWAVVHIYFLIGWRSRMLVSINWLWSYLTYDRGARLITGAGEGRAPGHPPPEPPDPEHPASE